MNRLFRSLTISAGALFLSFGSALAQSVQDYEPPRTASGHPDLSGHWTNSTITPFERPVELANKAFYTPEEYAARLDEALVITETEFGTTADVHYQLHDFGLDRSQNDLATNLRTSIIHEPANGRLPPITDQARALNEKRRAHRNEHGFDSAQDRPLAERCIVWPHEGPPLLPVGYNSNSQIVQTDEYVVLLIEMVHDARIIPFDGRPALSDRIPQWLGSSRGRWEGDTLVVETRNFTGETGIRGQPFSESAVVTERISRVADDTLLYQFTVNDPETFVQPWSGEYTMQRVDGPMFEYACHEGNYGIANNLSGARAEEQRAAVEAPESARR